MSKTKVEVFQPDNVEVDATVGGQTLAQLGIMVDNKVKKVDVQNVGDAYIYMANGAADANSYALLPGGSVLVRLTYHAIQTARFFCATTSDLNVLQSGD